MKTLQITSLRLLRWLVYGSCETFFAAACSMSLSDMYAALLLTLPTGHPPYAVSSWHRGCLLLFRVKRGQVSGDHLLWTSVHHKGDIIQVSFLHSRMADVHTCTKFWSQNALYIIYIYMFKEATLVIAATTGGNFEKQFDR